MQFLGPARSECAPGEDVDDCLQLRRGGLVTQVVCQLCQAGGRHRAERLLARPRGAQQRVLFQQLIQPGQVQPAS